MMSVVTCRYPGQERALARLDDALAISRAAALALGSALEV
jgi:hypothetical protein